MPASKRRFPPKTRNRYFLFFTIDWLLVCCVFIFTLAVEASCGPSSPLRPLLSLRSHPAPDNIKLLLVLVINAFLAPLLILAVSQAMVQSIRDIHAALLGLFLSHAATLVPLYALQNALGRSTSLPPALLSPPAIAAALSIAGSIFTLQYLAAKAEVLRTNRVWFGFKSAPLSLLPLAALTTPLLLSSSLGADYVLGVALGSVAAYVSYHTYFPPLDAKYRSKCLYTIHEHKAGVSKQ